MKNWLLTKGKFLKKSVRALADHGVVYISRSMARRLLRSGAASVIAEKPFTIRFVERISRRGNQLYGDREHRNHKEEVLAMTAWAREAHRRNILSPEYRRLMHESRQNRDRWEEIYDDQVDKIGTGTHRDPRRRKHEKKRNNSKRTPRT